MEDQQNYLAVNKESWNKRAVVHYDSEFYDNASFLAGRSSLNPIELELLGDVTNKSILHLQCHFGQDTLSLARLGAQVTGIDLSDQAIEKAKLLSAESGVPATFLCCDLYSLPTQLDQQFDIVFTSYGTISWLPDLDRWADVVAHFIKPGGRFVFAEFHPAVWMFSDDFSEVAYNYFKDDAIVETTEGSYAVEDAGTKLTSVCWNHSLGEVMTSLLRKNLRIDTFKEYNYSPYNCLAGMVEVGPNQFQIERFGNKFPLVYALLATK